jgi:AraC family transcriptional regulator
MSGFVYLRPLNMTYIRAEGPYAEAAREAWGKVYSWLDDTGMRASVGARYGLMLDDPATAEPGKCRYDACIEMIDGYQEWITDAFAYRRLPGGAYSRRRHVGGETLYAATETLRREWSSDNGLFLDLRRPIIQIFLDDPKKVADEKRRIDVLLPVATQARHDAA